MVYLNLQIDSIIAGLDGAGYIPESFKIGGAVTASVYAGQTFDDTPERGDLWLNTANETIYLYTGTDWKQLNLTASEKELLNSMSTYIAQAESFSLEAKDARDTILNVTIQTGEPGTAATWNPETGILVIPRGEQGIQGLQGLQGIQGIQGEQGIQGIQGEQGLPGGVLSVAGKTGEVTLVQADITDFNPDPTLATLTKTFVTNEQYVLPLSSATTTPVVAVQKEVGHTAESDNTWDVNVGEFDQEASLLDIQDGSISMAVQTVNDIDTISYTNISKDWQSDTSENTGTSTCFSPDGTKFFMVGRYYDKIHRYDLSTPWDITTAVYNSSSASTVYSDPYFLVFNDDGTRFYVGNSNNTTVQEKILSTPWDISGTITTGTTYSLGYIWNRDIKFKDNGNYFYTLDGAYGNFRRYALSTPYDLSTATYSGEFSGFSSQASGYFSFEFNTDGTKLYYNSTSTNTIYQYSLSTPWDVTTITYDNVNSGGLNTYVSMHLNEEDLKLFLSTQTSVLLYTPYTKEYTSNAYLPASTSISAQLNTSKWTDINSMTVTETLNGQSIYYALSNDDRTTWSIVKETDGTRNIVRNNAGTWEYNSNATYSLETWVSASTNDEYTALEESMTVSQNQMDSTQLNGTTDTYQLTLGDTLDLAVVLYSTDINTTPEFNGLTINYDAYTEWREATNGTDYIVSQFDSNNEVVIKSLTNNNYKVRVV